MADHVEVGSHVMVTVDCWDDLRDDGMGMSLCASKGEVLVVLGHSKYTEGRLFVSHEHIKDRSFTVDAGEYMLLPAQQPVSGTDSEKQPAAPHGEGER